MSTDPSSWMQGTRHFKQEIDGQGPATALPAALLANVLALLGQSCLQSAALVNSTWHAASVLAVSSIQVSSLDPSKAAALSGYLKAHAATANISSIEVQTGGSSCHSSESLNVQFPFMKSPLQSLKLNGMFMVNAAAATADNMFVDDEYIAHDASIGQHFMFNSCLGGPCASSLTQLDIASTQLYLSGLEDLTSLQRLSVVAGNFPAGLLRDNFLVLSMGLHHLQQLTSLRLGDYYTSAVPWSQLSGLTSLRELMLGAVNSGRLTFPEGSLPTSLTRFRVSAMCSSRDQLMFTAATATALAQLTALLVLELRTVGHVHVALLSALVHLQRLVISEGHQSTNGTLAAGPDEPRLSALTALTELQHLQLPALNDAQPAAVDAADFAAITASPQLTFLRFDLSPPKWTVSNGLSAADVPKVFAAQRQLLNLRHLVGLAGWLGHDGTAADPQHFGDRVPCLGHVVRCCPNLQQLVLQYDASVPELAHWDISSGMLQLAGLMELTRLDIDFSEGDVMTAFGILAKLTGLQDLVLRDFSDKYGQDVLVLTTLRQLTHLKYSVWDDATGMSQPFDHVEYELTNRAPACSPPDVWCQLPQLLLQQAAETFQAENPLGEQGDTRVMLTAAADIISHSLAVQYEQHQEIAQLRQQVAELQAGLAAVMRHLQLGDSAGQQQQQ